MIYNDTSIIYNRRRLASRDLGARARALAILGADANVTAHDRWPRAKEDSMTRMLRCTSLVLGLAAIAGAPRVSLAQRSPSTRRGAPGVVTPMTDVSFT